MEKVLKVLLCLVAVGGIGYGVFTIFPEISCTNVGCRRCAKAVRHMAKSWDEANVAIKCTCLNPEVNQGLLMMRFAPDVLERKYKDLKTNDEKIAAVERDYNITKKSGRSFQESVMRCAVKEGAAPGYMYPGR